MNMEVQKPYVVAQRQQRNIQATCDSSANMDRTRIRSKELVGRAIVA